MNRGMGLFQVYTFQGLTHSDKKESQLFRNLNYIETETLKMVHKSKNQLAPEYLNSMFVKLSKFRNRQLRDSDTDLYVPLLKTACSQKSFSHRGAKLWNSQQTEVKKAKSFTQLVKSLKNHRPKLSPDSNFFVLLVTYVYIIVDSFKIVK